MIGYKVMQLEDGKLVSGRDKKLTFTPKINERISMGGNGVYISPNKEYVLDY